MRGGRLAVGGGKRREMGGGYKWENMAGRKREAIDEKLKAHPSRLIPFRSPKEKYSKTAKMKIKEIRINLYPKMSADPQPTPSLAPFRLEFSPSYILVGVYRLSTDSSIRVPVWKKCKHGFIRGILVGFAWVSATTAAQPTTSPHRVLPGVLHVRNTEGPHPTLPVKVRQVLVTHHSIHSHPHPRSARVTGLSNHSFFGFTVPFQLTTCMRPLSSIYHLISHPRIHSPLSGRSACHRRTSEYHPQLLSPKKPRHRQAKSMGADGRLER